MLAVYDICSTLVILLKVASYYVSQLSARFGNVWANGRGDSDVLPIFIQDFGRDGMCDHECLDVVWSKG